MPLDPLLLEILACTLCKGNLAEDTAGDLFCGDCGRTYPVHDEIPVMLIDEARVDAGRVRAVLAQRGIDVIDRFRSPPTLPFTATYFPWSIIDNEETLKRALLYFDKIYLLAPQGDTLNDLLQKIETGEIRSPNLETLTEFYSRVALLRSAGVVETLPFDDIVADPTQRDALTEMAFQDAIGYDTGTLASRVSLSTLDSNTRIAHEFDPSTNDNSMLQYWTGFGADELFSGVSDRINHYIDSLPPQARALTRQSIRLPDAAIWAILCNLGLAVIDRAGSTPLLDSPRDFTYLRNRYKRMHDATVNAKADLNGEAMERLVARSHVKSGVLANYTLEILLPDVATIPFEEILAMRENFADALHLFRLKIAQLAGEMKYSVADPEFYFIGTVRIPCKHQLCRRFWNFRKKLAYRS
jgi:uncharacterized protein YbaR (Trm112 family)